MGYKRDMNVRVTACMLSILLQSCFLVFSSKSATNEPVDDVLSLARNLNLTSCAAKLTEAGVEEVINGSEGQFTLFCPINDAFDREVDFPGVASLADKMLQHVTWGRLTSSDFSNELTVKSLLPGSRVRVNIYTAGMFSTVTTNGQGVMDSVYRKPGSVVSQLVESCPNTSTTLRLAFISGLYPILDRTDPITLLAPTNAAWESLPSGFLDFLENNRPLLQKVLLAHALPSTWYSAGTSRGDQIKSMFGSRVLVEKDRQGRVCWGGANTTLGDVAARNGVIQVVDKVILPKTIWD